MPEAVGYGQNQAFQPSLATPRADKVAEQVKAMNARQSEAVAETVQRQAKFSSNRTENLSRQAEQLEKRAETRKPEDGLGNRVDIFV
ncbi:hypothetical protein K1718_02565 [Roseibium porphyridii]|uniref:Uncharacterized protein n=1 Tax=Roseibium porphyridii TaxID=2866279 RepID=A0ABY8F438_9HYPH|nr:MULTISPECIES: hypothetical protein [Stappiaceae]QFT29262.1 hypothetical protein FIV00_02075 [Labrenzia sp. THAF82]WFE90251.1 hypothetical protein K1718_02565 [Roseibium sp. KMA01]